MKWNGPDSINSWIIDLACCFINTMFFGMSRLSGVLFVASMTRFNVGRKQASFPYTLAAAIRNLSGPLAGYLGYKFGVRAITALGALIGATAAALCYFAETIVVVTYVWGVVFGLGFGFGNILLPIPVNQYFQKHRASALGICFSGACLGSFILPPVVEILLNNYGLSQTYLFLSGFILNCVPAAMLLRKPNFKIQRENYSDDGQSEKQHINSGAKKTLYTVECDYAKNETLEKCKSIENYIPSNIEDDSKNYTALSYEERVNRLSTQTLFSGYSVHMSTSEPLDDKEIMENSKGRRKVDFKILDGETLSLSSESTDQDIKSEKDDVFDKDNCVSDDQHKNTDIIKYSLALLENNMCNEKDIEGTYQDYCYQPENNEINNISKDSNKCHVAENSKNYFSEHSHEHISNFKYPRGVYPDTLMRTPECIKISSQNLSKHSKSDDSQDHDRKNNRSVNTETKILSSLSQFTVLYDPAFILITVNNAIYSFSFMCMLTIIVDFSRDINIGISNEKYVLMLFSVGDIAGRLGLGWITDRGYMRTTKFAAACFASQAIVIFLMVWSTGFASLVTFVALYGFSQAGIILILPVIISQYIDQDKQSIAISSYHLLSGPLCLVISPLIGYVRDQLGAYDWMFYIMSILSAASSVSWMFIQYLAKCRRIRPS